jgi:hypothetical protein
VTFVDRFFVTGESLPLVDFSPAMGWLELPALWIGLPELLATERGQPSAEKPALQGSF